MSNNIPTNFAGLSDFGYQQASYDDGGIAYVMWARANIPGFPDNVQDADKRLVYQGYLARKHDITPAKHYVRDGVDAYRITNAPGTDTITVDINFVMSWTQQAFGTLKASQPNLYAICKPVREDANKYTSNKWKRLLALDRVLADNGARKRTGNASYAQFLQEVCESLVTRAKTALARGDETAPGMERAKAMAAALMKNYTK